MRVAARAPCVYVLIANWNGRHHLEVCLPSLLATDYPQMQVMVVDNGSADGSQDWVRQHFPDVKLIELEENRGFVGANNRGMMRALDAGADYVTLLNNDTRVEPAWLQALVETAEADQAVAICQGRQRTWDGENDVRFRFIPEWAEAEAVKTAVKNEPGEAKPVAFASGAVMFLRCEALRKLGLLDSRYFAYVEDVDLSLRAWIAGYKVLDVPHAIIYHRMFGTNMKERMYLGYRNQLTTILKLYESRTLRQFAPQIYRRWLRNRYAWPATLDSLKMLPGTLVRRSRIQKERRVPDSRFLRLAEGRLER